MLDELEIERAVLWGHSDGAICAALPAATRAIWTAPATVRTARVRWRPVARSMAAFVSDVAGVHLQRGSRSIVPRSA